MNELWEDPETGLTSFAQFRKTAKEHGITITVEKLKEWYDQREENQVTKRVTRNVASFIPIQCPDNVECLQMDLMDISKYSAQNSNFKFLFNVLHLNTRYVWSFPVKTKSPTSIDEHLESVIMKARTDANEITVTSDDGTEFKGSVASLLKKYKIKHYVSVDTNNTANIERFHRTLWGYINKYATAKKTLKFVDVIPQLITKYNRTMNRAIKATPESLWKSDRVELPKRRAPKAKLQIGDRVRFLVKRETFDKRSFKNMLSEQIFTINSRVGNRFTLSNGNAYLERELVKVSDINQGVQRKPVEITEDNTIKEAAPTIAEQITKVQKTNEFINPINIVGV